MHNAVPGNPFRYGTVVDDPFFINRVKELAEVKQSLLSGQNLIIYSPRRYGKTSLIKKVLKSLGADGHPFVFIDFFRIHSKEKFIEEYTREVFKNYPSWEKALKKVITMVKTVQPVVTLNEKGLPEFSMKFSRNEIPQAIEEVVNLPEKLAGEKRWIIVLDEFQEIERLNGESFEKELRSFIQLHQNISYVFMGSRKHLLTNIFTRKNRAFYNFGRLYKLDRIPGEDLIAYLEKGFEASGLKVDPAVFIKLLALAGNIPFYVQMLASVLWDLSAGKHEKVTGTLLDEAVKTSLWHQTDYYMALLQELTAYQQKVLHAIAVENSGIFTKDYANRFFLSAGSSTQRALATLIEKDILNKHDSTYDFEDPLFRIWLLNND